MFIDTLLSGRALDLIVVAMLVEAIVLTVAWRRVRSVAVIAFLGAGIALVVAMRLRLSAAPPAVYAMAMLVALGCHGWCLKEMAMAHIDECVPGRDAKILRCGVPRVIGKVGRIAEVMRVQASRGDPVRDTVTVDVAGHGPVVVAPDDLEIVAARR